MTLAGSLRHNLLGEVEDHVRININSVPGGRVATKVYHDISPHGIPPHGIPPYGIAPHGLPQHGVVHSRGLLLSGSDNHFHSQWRLLVSLDVSLEK